VLSQVNRFIKCRTGSCGELYNSPTTRLPPLNQCYLRIHRARCSCRRIISGTAYEHKSTAFPSLTNPNRMIQTPKCEAFDIPGVTNRSAQSEHRGYDEGFIVKDGEVVGKSEIQRYQYSIFILTRLSQNTHHGLVIVKNSTARLILEVPLEGGGFDRQYGTAFFFTKHHLITAGHNVYAPGKRTTVYITYPGSETVRPKEGRNPNWIKCKVVYSGYKTSAHLDIAILECDGHVANYFVRLDTNIAPQTNCEVRIVGYPCEIRWRFIKRHPVHDYVKNIRKGSAILPPDTLVASVGIVDEIEEHSIYHQASTCEGMSGGCLLYNGRACGIFHLSY
jgi:hypothetical protein